MANRCWLRFFFVFSLVLFFSCEAFALDSELLAGRESVLEQVLHLKPDTTYELSLRLRTDLQDSVATLSVELYDRRGNRMGFWRTYRGLGNTGGWQHLGIEIDTPMEEGFTAKLIVTASKAGRYWWEDLQILRLDKSFDGVRAFWETKFATYDTVYTGLVLDTRGFGVERGMSPRVYSESGQLIYAGATANMDFIQRRGVVSYGRELDPRIFERIQADPSYPYVLPLVIPIHDIADHPSRANVVITDLDARMVLEALAVYDFLARFGVVFIID